MVERLRLTGRALESAAKRSPVCARRQAINDDLFFVALVMSEPAYANVAGNRYKALRLLLRWADKDVLRFVGTMADPASVALFKLSVSFREPADAVRSKALRQRLQDYLLTRDIQLKREQGESRDAAIDAVLRQTDNVMKGRDGALKSMARTKKGARERGFVHELWPAIAYYLGGNVEPEFRSDQLASRGRPTKPPKSE